MQIANLLFVASVDDSHKLVCQAPGCGRSIAKAVHVVRDECDAVRVIGSGCYAKLLGSEAATAKGATFAGFEGRRLAPEERALMAADTAAFVASIEARLAAEQEAAQRVEGEGPRGSLSMSDLRAPRRPTRGAWTSWGYTRSESMRPAQRMEALDKLARFRAQQARAAAQFAMQRWPELSAHSVEEVSDALVQAKAQYLASGRRMDAPDARRSIELAAVALLAGRGR